MEKIILVVEDEALLSDAIKDKLEEKGYFVFTSANVDGAIEILNKSEKMIDAVWLDHYLPGGNGLQLVTFMKDENSKFREIPIFLVSNSSSSEKIYQYLQLGVEGYFAKAESKLEDIITNIERVLTEKNGK